MIKENGNLTVLLVDDDLQLLKLGRRVLEKMGYKTVTYSASTEALEYIKKNYQEINILITDKKLPYLSGKELALEAKSICENIGTIISSGDHIEEKTLNEYKIDKSLSKPYTQTELKNTIKNVLQMYK